MLIVQHDSLTPRRTGHEDFPHPALTLTFASGHRSCCAGVIAYKYIKPKRLNCS
jgi:hypothetical protein